MIEILSKRDHRYLIILETLFDSNFKTMSELARLTKSSKRNVQFDITAINEFIEPMYIATSQKEGCTLIYPENVSMDHIYSCILHNSLEFSLIEAVFFEKKQRLEDYAELLFVSLSTLKRMIQKINKVVGNLEFKISTYPVQLVGNEKRISRTMYMFFIEKYRFDQLPFKAIQIKTLDKLIEVTVRKQEMFYNFPDLRMVTLIFLITFTRLRHGHEGPSLDRIPKEFDISFVDNFFLKQIFKSVYKVELNKETLVRLFYPFINGKFAVSYAHLQSLMEESEETRIEVTDIDNFLESVSNEFDLQLPNKEQLTFELFNVYHLNAGQNYLIYNKKRVFLNTFLENSPYAADFIYGSIQRASPLTEESTEHEIEELVYIFITHWEGFAEITKTLKPQFKAGIFMDSDVEHSKFIAEILNSQFKDEISFDVIRTATVDEMFEKSNECAFIVTNMSNFPSKKVPFICIGMSITPKDINHIANFYAYLIAQEKKNR